MNWLEDAANKFGNRVAVVYANESLTYRELNELANQDAIRLGKLPNRVGVFMDNSLDSLRLIHALMKRGIEIVVLNTRLTKCELVKQLVTVQVDTVISTVELELDNMSVLFFKDMNSEEVEINTAIDEHSILTIMFTSGTTGNSKAVTQSYKNHFASHQKCQYGMEYDQFSKWLMVNPIFHISGFSILIRTVLSGSTLIIHNKFNAEQVINEIRGSRVTHTSFVPLMLRRILDDLDVYLDSLEGILMGGANTTPKLLRDAIQKGLPVYNSFGMTETCSQIMMIKYTDDHILAGAVGKVTDHIKVKEDGTLLVKGDNVTTQYLNAEIEYEGEYFNTGDVARVDDGYVYILDRRQDLIISGGENIYPKEIEEIVAKYIGTRSCVVVKKQDDTWGEVPVLLIDGAPNRIIEHEIKSHFDRALARYKHPKEIRFVESIIYTDTGKISRKLNQEKYIK
ncbi:o-succinylbenzoate--CoA ligase [Phocicoccus pinnipedialis]|uniref:2-succinylbenzoate--CoA ligase n=2 Tax=Phocicoccus pinnipedialis TaxID=110845 RepID=A0A6V7RBB3_9BACL|nr:o-succinylbenzoate--CoA ligase [Jeotgalicoccus pinnipedialis]CAD2074923.1 2-succinylbenzoate--CoA ligase [Jeotgalicoccus pinnipedialis]